MMRTLLILVCTINVLMTGCKTGTKQSACGTGASCGAPCGGCVQIGAATVNPVQQQAAAPVEKPQPKPVMEVSHSNQTVNPFEGQPAQVQPKPEPAELPVPNHAHAENYGWLIGELQRVHAPAHQWKIRYAGLDEHDEWGGSVVLAPDARLDQCNNGDQVYVEGEILTARPSLYLSGPLYRLRTIRPASEMVRISQD